MYTGDAESCSLTFKRQLDLNSVTSTYLNRLFHNMYCSRIFSFLTFALVLVIDSFLSLCYILSLTHCYTTIHVVQYLKLCNNNNYCVMIFFAESVCVALRYNVNIYLSIFSTLCVIIVISHRNVKVQLQIIKRDESLPSSDNEVILKASVINEIGKPK